MSQRTKKFVLSLCVLVMSGVSPTGLSKHELVRDDNNGYAKGDREKPRRPQSHTKNILRNTENGKK